MLLLALAVVPTPARAQFSDNLGWATAGAGAALLGSALLDRPLREELFLESNHAADGGARLASALAEPVVLVPTFALAYGAGYFLHDPSVRTGVERATAALAISVAAGGAVKTMIGRVRPDAGADPDAFYPFSTTGRRQSFPSGHTAAAFAVATTLADLAPSPALKVLAIAPAVAVGWSRLYADAHWSSDVVAGALLGVASAHLARSLFPDAGGQGAFAVAVTSRGVDARFYLPIGTAGVHR
jgi:membrane-associated phospholipid phosphatase